MKNKCYYLTVKMDKKMTDSKYRLYADISGRQPASNKYLAYVFCSSLNNAYKYFADNGYIIKSKSDGWFITEKLLKMNNNNELIY